MMVVVVGGEGGSGSNGSGHRAPLGQVVVAQATSYHPTPPPTHSRSVDV